MTTSSKSKQFQSSTIMLGVLAVLAAAGPARPQTPASANAVKNPEGGYSLVDLSGFFGDQWYQIYQGSGGNGNQQYFLARPVFGTRLTENFSRYVSLEEGYTVGFNKYAIRPAGSGGYLGINSTNGLASLVGIFNFTPRDRKFRPYVLVGPGAITYRANGSYQTPTDVPVIYPQAWKTQTYAALVYGLGAKINLTKKFAIGYDLRGVYSSKTAGFGLPSIPNGTGSLFVDHSHGESSLQFEVSAIFRFGWREPPPPPAPPPPPPPPAPEVVLGVSIQGAPASACPGDNVPLRATATGIPAGQTAMYTWSVNGTAVPGANGDTFSLPTANASGNQSVTVTVAASGAMATSSPVSVPIGALAPPTITFTVSPSTITYGDKLPLNAMANASSCGMPVSVAYAASEGSVAGNTFDSTGVSFDLNNRLKQQSKTVTLTATATDAKNQMASATAPVTINLVPEARRLDDIVFQPRSSRVNNCGKRLLIDVLTPILRNDPDAKVILIGHRDMNEPPALHVDEQRTLNAAAVLSAGTGICPSLDLSRVLVKWVGDDQASMTRPALCGSSTDVKERRGQAVSESDTRAQYRRVEVWVVPGGAAMPADITGLMPAPEKEVKAKGCPK
jgi:outer membrane protein OmpA-like peptidoglycan-associated protein